VPPWSSCLTTTFPDGTLIGWKCEDVLQHCFACQSNIHVWHGEKSIADVKFVGDVMWDTTTGVLFDNNRGVPGFGYHSQHETGDRGVLVQFYQPVIFIDLQLYTRGGDRYKNVCLTANETTIGRVENRKHYGRVPQKFWIKFKFCGYLINSPLWSLGGDVWPAKNANLQTHFFPQNMR